MSQHDMDILGGSGATVRADINLALKALASNSSGAAAPVTPYAYQFWVDSQTGELKVRNGNNDKWIVLGNVGKDNFGLVVEQPSQLTNYLHPSVDGGWRDVYRAGWLPYWFNQQWGGAQYGGLPDGSNGDIATSNVQDDNSVSHGSLAGDMFTSQGFKVSETISTPVVWVKLYKVGNPTDNVSIALYSDTAGAPNAAVCAAGTRSGKEITSKSDGEWYAFSVAAGPLSPNTQYHVLATRSGASDAANHYRIKQTRTNTYPHGYVRYGSTSACVTPQTTWANCFKIQNPTANKCLQSGGQFDALIKFLEGAPLDQSKVLGQPMRNFFDGNAFTVLHRFKNLPVSKTIAEFMYGVDHERLVIYTDASGYINLRFYDQIGTVNNITTTTVVTGASLVDIGVKGLFNGTRRGAAGTDALTLYVNGVSVGTPLTAKTWDIGNSWRDLGTAILGGGFPVAPTWTKDTTMTSLPSGDGWTFTGTGTEATIYSVSGGKLYSNGGGTYGASQTAYYQRTNSFVNATGWAAVVKVRSTKGTGGMLLQINDNLKYMSVGINGYYMPVGSAVIDANIQIDMQNPENVITVLGVDSNYYVFVNGQLAVDGTGKLTQATAAANKTNYGVFGGGWATFPDSVCDYIKEYSGAFLPQAVTGGELHEFAFWSDDKTALLPYAYNSGAPVSIKQLCGVSRNYVGEGVVQKYAARLVSGVATTTSTTYVVLPEMELFTIGNALSIDMTLEAANSGISAVYSRRFVDGRAEGTTSYHYSSTATANSESANTTDVYTYTGLHKIDARWAAQANTASSPDRLITVTSRS